MPKLLGSTLGANIKRIRLRCGLTQEETIANCRPQGLRLVEAHILL